MPVSYLVVIGASLQARFSHSSPGVEFVCGALCQSAIEERLAYCTHLTHVGLNGCLNVHDLNWGSSGGQLLELTVNGIFPHENIHESIEHSNFLLQNLNCVGCPNNRKVLIPPQACCFRLSSLDLSLSANLKEVDVACFNFCFLNLSFLHELGTARINGLLGNIDASTADPQIGWATDQFLTGIGEGTMSMLGVIQNGGLALGGFNFDAKLRRDSTDVENLFIAHIVGMYILARGLRNAAKLIEDGSLTELVRKRYQSFDSEIGAKIEVMFEYLQKKAMEWVEAKVPYAKQELAEMLF